jgi:hypothetical protein
LAENAAVAPVNLALHSMFSSLEVQLCGKSITDKDTLYPYRAFIETLLTYGDDVLNTRAKLSGWHLDKTASAMDRVIMTTTGNVDPNEDFVQRSKTTAQSRTLTLVGRLHADLFHQNLDIPANCPIMITLTRSNSAFALMAEKDSGYHLVLESAKLYVRSKKLTPELIMAHRQMLTDSNFRFPHTAVTMRKHTIAAGSSEKDIAELIGEKLPKRIVVGLVNHKRVTGDYSLNPFKFENFNMTSISLKVGGNAVPREALITDYSKGDYARAYLSTLGALGLDIGNRALTLTPELWAEAYNLHAFKLVAGPIDVPTQSLQQKAAVSLCLKFSAALAESVEVIVYCETESMLEINNLNTAFVH